MPAIPILVVVLTTLGATYLGYYLLGPSPSEQQKQCVKKVTEAINPNTVSGVKDIVKQCKERYLN
ncbi:hypothetical protein SPONL_1434 [uncultured Candidatus Thioglobus sp.]|nr:hypothetical protein SPONL_1434 [uncultured Candidatus Thioglobus sp.]